jgi:PAS domain S-box-containing protein
MEMKEEKSKDQIIKELCQKIKELEKEENERKKVEEALKESEERYRSIVENSHAGILIVGEDYKFIYVNDELCRILEYSREEIIGHDFREFLDEESKQLVADRYIRRQRGEKVPSRYEFNVVQKNGEKRRVEISSTVIKDSAGKVRTVAQILDITEHKKAEEEIKHLNIILRAIRKVNQLITREKNRDRLLKSACDNLIETRGYYTAWITIFDESGGLVTTAEAGLGEKFLPMIEQLKRGELPGCTRKALEQSDVVINKDPLSTCTDCTMLENCTGGIRTMTVRLEYGGRVYGVLHVTMPAEFIIDKEEQSLFKEVTGDLVFALHNIEREEERKRAEKKLSTIYNLSKEMALSLDLDRISEIVLDATEKVLNFGNVDLFLLNEKKNELRVKDARGLKEPERYMVIPLYGEKGISAHVARTGKSLNIPDVRKDERYLLGLKESRSELCVPIKVKDKVIGVIDAESKELNAFSEEDQRLLETLASQAAIAMENTRLFSEEKKAREQKEKSRKEAEFYSDVLGHDVGNINQIISGYLYLLENAKDEETRKKNVRGIKKSIMRSKRLAESIKTLKIIKDTKIEKFDLNKSIERSIENIKEYSDREIEVNLDVDKKYYVKANDFLDKVFFNIFENAVEYTFHDPVIIDVRTEEKDGFCNVHICDYGLGISKEKREDILENLETLSKRTGMGFYLTKKILDRLNGKLEIKDVEKGTEIVVSIPVINGGSARNVHPQRSHKRNKQGRR